MTKNAYEKIAEGLREAIALARTPSPTTGCPEELAFRLQPNEIDQLVRDTPARLEATTQRLIADPDVRRLADQDD